MTATGETGAESGEEVVSNNPGKMLVLRLSNNRFATHHIEEPPG